MLSANCPCNSQNTYIHQTMHDQIITKCYYNDETVHTSIMYEIEAKRNQSIVFVLGKEIETTKYRYFASASL
jgi:hypothetical protein